MEPYRWKQTGAKDDEFGIIRNTVVEILEQHGNTVLNEREFKQGVRRLYSKKMGIKITKNRVDYTQPKDPSIKKAMQVWKDYISSIVGFEVTVRIIPSAAAVWGTRDTSDVACVIIEKVRA